VTSAVKTPVRGPVQSSQLAGALELVETRLREQIRSREPLLSEIASYLIASGGKRVRPAVTILIFRACGGDELSDIIDVATALELIHSASLLHDDIIDGSDVRRGRESALRKFGLANTLVAGDFVFSRAFQLCARFDAELIHWAVEACVALTEGEMMQGRFRHNPAVTLADYLEIISRKTASIFQQGARTAAHLAGAGAQVVDDMAACGFNVGMAFQMVDDLLDVQGNPGRVGKPVGLDLRDGNPSLPVVLALARDAELVQLFRESAPATFAIDAALRRLRESGVLAEVHTLAAQYGARAYKTLNALPASPAKDQLLALIDQLTERAE
jgi:octaprenyl-diphosphate synthase